MRDWLSHHPATAAISTVAIVMLAVFIVLHVARGPALESPPDERYYLDVQTGEWFAGPVSNEPPTSSAGNPSVPAEVFGCTGCENEDELMLGFVRQSLDHEEAVEAGVDEIDAMFVSVDGERWVSVTSSEGQQIMQPPDCPDGSRAQRCMPGG